MFRLESLKHQMAALVAMLILLPPAAQSQSMNVVDLSMVVGKSLVIDYPVEIGRISTSNPEVVDAVPATAKEFLLHGKGHGSATVVVWAKNGSRTMYNLTVEHNIEPIRKLISETFPNEDIHIQSARDSVSLVGRVSSKEVADRALAIATPLARTVVSNLQLGTPPVEQQIMLKVRFAELNRNAGSQFGINLISTGAGNTPGRVTTGQFAAPSASSVTGTIGGSNSGYSSQFSVSDALNIFAFRPDLNIGAVIRALQNQDVLQILAEPNLVTVNGKEASFLVGGEFPVPVLQGGANAGAVTIQFREFGIRLTFNPLVTGNGTIKMYIKPEVSTIDLSNAISLSGFTIPALATRRMETNVELKEGQSFVLAGLMDDRVTDQMSKLPGLANIPVLGALFKSRLERKTKTELVVIVTPEIVKAPQPGDKLQGPEFPREFLNVQPFKMQSKKQPDPAKHNTDDQVKKAEAGANKNPFFFWRNGKKPAAGQQEITDQPVVTATPQGSPVTTGLQTASDHSANPAAPTTTAPAEPATTPAVAGDSPAPAAIDNRAATPASTTPAAAVPAPSPAAPTQPTAAPGRDEVAPKAGGPGQASLANRARGPLVLAVASELTAIPDADPGTPKQ